jgi:uncharacterized protein YjeT (DUF2065 family)
MVGGLAAAFVLALLGLLHLFLPERAWRLYRRPQAFPDDSTLFNLRLLGAAMLAFGGLVAAVVCLLL